MLLFNLHNKYKVSLSFFLKLRKMKLTKIRNVPEVTQLMRDGLGLEYLHVSLHSQDCALPFTEKHLHHNAKQNCTYDLTGQSRHSTSIPSLPVTMKKRDTRWFHTPMFILKSQNFSGISNVLSVHLFLAMLEGIYLAAFQLKRRQN